MKNKFKKLVAKIKRAFTSKTDPDGSYTGNPADNNNPTQDADDL